MDLMGLLHRLYANVVIMGDLNTRMNLCDDGYNSAGRFLENALKNSKLFARIASNEPTYRNQSVLDHAIVSKNLAGIVQQRRATASSLAGVSDHVPIIIQLEMPEVKPLSNPRLIINKEKAARIIEQRIDQNFDFSCQDFSKS